MIFYWEIFWLYLSKAIARTYLITITCYDTFKAARCSCGKFATVDCRRLLSKAREHSRGHRDSGAEVAIKFKSKK